jgi:hypothetical protein
VEDFDEGEYLFASDLFGKTKEKTTTTTQHRKMTCMLSWKTLKAMTTNLLPTNLTTVRSSCIVGKELPIMSDEAIDPVNVAFDKRLNKVKDKEVESCLLLEKYQALLEEYAATQLKNNT